MLHFFSDTTQLGLSVSLVRLQELFFPFRYTYWSFSHLINVFAFPSMSSAAVGKS